MIYDLAALVNYHDQQITSRELTEKFGLPAATTLYAFAAGETISAEQSPQNKLLYVLAGELTVITDRSLTIQSGQLLTLAAGVTHRLLANQPCKFLQIELG
ncbi:cupin domain-containing protein [Lapidilactobacillus achengensis]|uniref:Cupin domain-containing protein n=1 Tax=Lapidilactobacillus achengensis TaxID=2486000 RepID=A0ABW1URS7_9LACO|nr:cupin domain-containing protein [Lapidilactobacillus achengensis]